MDTTEETEEAAETVSSGWLSPEQARALVLGLERLGVETNRIKISADHPTSADATSRVDRRSMTRPARRVLAGAAGGLLFALALGLTIALVTEGSAGPLLVGLGVGGVVVGGLAGLYSRLTVSTELADVDAGHPSAVSVDVSGLDGRRIRSIESAIASQHR